MIKHINGDHRNGQDEKSYEVDIMVLESGNKLIVVKSEKDSMDYHSVGRVSEGGNIFFGLWDSNLSYYSNYSEGEIAKIREEIICIKYTDHELVEIYKNFISILSSL